jgi:hypothetical protein
MGDLLNELHGGWKFSLIAVFSLAIGLYLVPFGSESRSSHSDQWPPGRDDMKPGKG